MDVKENIQFYPQKFRIYCERVAVAVGYLSIKIFGVDSKVGTIMRMSWYGFSDYKHVRDFHEDLNNDRCYIPSEKFENSV